MQRRKKENALKNDSFAFAFETKEGLNYRIVKIMCPLEGVLPSRGVTSGISMVC